MTKQKDLKRLIRARMAKTGERYTTARSHILSHRDPVVPHEPRLRPRRRPVVRIADHRATMRDDATGRILRGGYVDRVRLRLREGAIDWRALLLSTPAIVLTILIALTGCTDGAPSGMVASDSSGVEVVEHRGGSIEAAQAWRLSADPVLEIGAGADPEPALYRIVDVAPLPDGGVVVGTDVPPQALVLASDGSLSATLGGPGEGPGEFASVASVVPMGVDSVAVWDADRRRLAVYGTDGRFGRAVDLSEVAPPSARGAPDASTASGITKLLPYVGGGFVVFGEGAIDPSPEPGIGRPALPSVRISAAGERLGAFGPFPGMEWVHGGPAGALPLPLGARTYAVTAGELLVVGTAETTELRAFGPDGSLRRIVRWPDRDRTVEGPYLAQWTAFVEAADPSIRQLTEELPRRERFPAYAGLVATDRGGVMVGEYAGPVGIWSFTRGDATPDAMRAVGRVPRRRWLVFDADGILAATLETPEGFEPYAVRDGRVWGVYSDSFDVETVRAYAILDG